MSSCLFCGVVSNKVNAEIVYNDDLVMAFRDINPQAPLHDLIIPKTHISTLNDLEVDHQNLIGHMFLVAKKLATKAGYAERGYRTVFNCNGDAGQAVYHIHLHLLGGRVLGWPPG